MKSIQNMKTKNKLILGYAIPVIIIILISVLGIANIRSVNNGYVYSYEFPNERFNILTQISVRMLDSGGLVPSIVLQGGNEPAINQLAQGTDANHERLLGYADAFRQNVNADPRLSTAEKAHLTELMNQTEALFIQFKDTVIDPIIAAARIGDMAAIGAAFALEANLRAQIFERHMAMVNEAEETFAAVRLSAANTTNNITWTLVGISVGAIVIVIILAAYIGGLIIKPLVASVTSLNQIGEALDAAVSQVNDSAKIIAENSNEQAASIEEMSATINETTSMLTATAENTRTAEQTGNDSVDIANDTGRHMMSTLETMVKLKESSGRVGKIVKTIDDIAFQTNLLAINATVEAARAGGDAGRSFGVVAEEVRNLAQKSATQAAETSEIIEKNMQLTNTVQAETETVLGLAKESTERLTDLIKLIAEVSAASAEQASGAQQISVAISQIEKSTQSNAATSQESAASAATLKELVSDLEKICHNVNAVVYGSK